MNSQGTAGQVWVVTVNLPEQGSQTDEPWVARV